MWCCLLRSETGNFDICTIPMNFPLKKFHALAGQSQIVQRSPPTTKTPFLHHHHPRSPFESIMIGTRSILILLAVILLLLMNYYYSWQLLASITSMTMKPNALDATSRPSLHNTAKIIVNNPDPAPTDTFNDCPVKVYVYDSINPITSNKTIAKTFHSDYVDNGPSSSYFWYTDINTDKNRLPLVLMLKFLVAR